MKKSYYGLLVVVFLCQLCVQPLTSHASEMKSDVGLTYIKGKDKPVPPSSSSSSDLPKTGGSTGSSWTGNGLTSWVGKNLPSTGEKVTASFVGIGALLLAIFVFVKARQRKGVKK